MSRFQLIVRNVIIATVVITIFVCCLGFFLLWIETKIGSKDENIDDLYHGSTNSNVINKPRSNSNIANNDENDDTKNNDKHSLLSHAVPRSNSIIHQSIEMVGFKKTRRVGTSTVFTPKKWSSNSNNNNSNNNDSDIGKDNNIEIKNSDNGYKAGEAEDGYDAVVEEIDL